jgi:hypothetical protein
MISSSPPQIPVSRHPLLRPDTGAGNLSGSMAEPRIEPKVAAKPAGTPPKHELVGGALPLLGYPGSGASQVTQVET